MVIRTLTVTVGIALALAGCRQEPSDEQVKQQIMQQLQQGVDQWQQQQQAQQQAMQQAQQAQQAAQQAQQAAAAPAVGGRAGLQLVATGTGPLRQLRYAFEPGDLGRLRVDVGLTGTNPSGRGPRKIVMPTLRFVLALAGQTLPDGTYRVDFSTADVDVLPRKGAIKPLIQHLKPSMEKARPFAGSVVIDDRGQVRQTSIPVMLGARREIKQPFDLLTGVVRQLAAPLPAEPVGTGASWTVSRGITTFELTAQEQVTYTLEELTDQGGRLGFAVTRSASAQPWTAASGAPTQVTAYSYSATGTRDFSLASPVPTVKMSSKSSRTVLSGGGQPKAMPIEIEVDVGPSR
jgi:type II secretory pathway pseudopilin PulG